VDPRGVHGTVVLSRAPLGRARELPTDGDCLMVPVRLGQRDVRLLAVHPRNLMHPELWREDHAALAQAMRTQRPAVVAGDFNATVEHEQMQAYRRLGYRSAAEIRNAGWRPTWPGNGHREVLGVALPPMVQIDHVMVARGLTVTEVEFLDVSLTDHAGVVAEVALR
jgi:endonuclease/exonuclease/phosphatase family metal-dependent hydrolase